MTVLNVNLSKMKFLKTNKIKQYCVFKFIDDDSGRQASILALQGIPKIEQNWALESDAQMLVHL